MNTENKSSVLVIKDRGRIRENHILIDEGYDLIGEALDAYMGTHVVAVTLSDKIKEMRV